MKPIFEEFLCKKCKEIRYIKVNGICFDCNNENSLLTLAKQRKLQHKLNFSFGTLGIESFN